MNDMCENNGKYEELIRLERAIESNVENLQKSRKLAGFTWDDEAIYARVIKKQEELLFGLI
jgi:hypothetical protein